MRYFIGDVRDKEIKDREQIDKTRSKEVLNTQNQIDNLTRMRYRGLVEEDEYIRERKLLQVQLASLKQDRGETEDRAVK
jgi:hypothetical protein